MLPLTRARRRLRRAQNSACDTGLWAPKSCKLCDRDVKPKEEARELRCSNPKCCLQNDYCHLSCCVEIYTGKQTPWQDGLLRAGKRKGLSGLEEIVNGKFYHMPCLFSAGGCRGRVLACTKYVGMSAPPAPKAAAPPAAAPKPAAPKPAAPKLAVPKPAAPKPAAPKPAAPALAQFKAAVPLKTVHTALPKPLVSTTPVGGAWVTPQRKSAPAAAPKPAAPAAAPTAVVTAFSAVQTTKPCIICFEDVITLAITSCCGVPDICMGCSAEVNGRQRCQCGDMYAFTELYVTLPRQAVAQPLALPAAQAAPQPVARPIPLPAAPAPAGMLASACDAPALESSFVTELDDETPKLTERAVETALVVAPARADTPQPAESQASSSEASSVHEELVSEQELAEAMYGSGGEETSISLDEHNDIVARLERQNQLLQMKLNNAEARLRYGATMSFNVMAQLTAMQADLNMKSAELCTLRLHHQYCIDG